MEIEAEVEASLPTSEESAKAVLSSTMLTPIPIDTAVVSSPKPSPTPIYSIVTSTSQVPSILVPICDAMTETLL